MTQKYTAINIGPIIPTLDMAHGPRELWAASYLFSYLMKCIIEQLPKDNIISPATFKKEEKNGIGLYPDRVFIKMGDASYKETIEPVITNFAKDYNISSDYFNVMSVSGEYEKDSEAIKDLNSKLDRMELYNRAKNSSDEDNIRGLIGLKFGSKLFEDAFGTKKFPVDTLGEIAAIELSGESGWNDFVNAIRSDEKEKAEKAYDKLPKEKLRSYHKYICVVQADGDNVGKTVSHSSLENGQVKKISNELLEFGKKAKKAIDDYGGMPIYAGGDDLLFIAPVVGKNHLTILNLLDQLNKDAFKGVREKIDPYKLKTEDEKKKVIHASLSFGVSVSYYKYPLYEALDNARKLLFEKAKKVDGNAISFDFRKHSGGSFYMELSGANEDLKNAFNAIVSTSKVEDSVVSAIAHKIRSNSDLLSLWAGKERNGYFFKNYLEYEPDKVDVKKSDSDFYKDASLELLNVLTQTSTDKTKITSTMYAMLRIAKFINGEEVKDE